MNYQRLLDLTEKVLILRGGLASSEHNAKTLNGVPYSVYCGQLGPDPSKWTGRLFQAKSQTVGPVLIMKVNISPYGFVQNIVTLGPELTRRYIIDANKDVLPMSRAAEIKQLLDLTDDILALRGGPPQL